jgi:predicted XRE-type DNA-binding protein
MTEPKMRSTGEDSHAASSGNVFEDLGVSAPTEAMPKSELAVLIGQSLRARGLTQVAAARLLGIDQPKVSELLRGRLTRFSTERLMQLLLRLGRDLDIVVRGPAAGRGARPGRIQVRAMAVRRARSGPVPVVGAR